MQRHYVCSECGYTSHFPGTCQNDDCINQGTKLTECHCEDDKHDMALSPYSLKRRSENSESLEGEEKESKEDIEDEPQTGNSIKTIDLDSNLE